MQKTNKQKKPKHRPCVNIQLFRQNIKKDKNRDPSDCGGFVVTACDFHQSLSDCYCGKKKTSGSSEGKSALLVREVRECQDCFKLTGKTVNTFLYSRQVPTMTTVAIVDTGHRNWIVYNWKNVAWS